MATRNNTPRARIVRKSWTIEEVTFLINNMHLSNKDLAARLGRTGHAVINKLSKLRKNHRISTRSEAICNVAVKTQTNNGLNDQPVKREGFYFEEPIEIQETAKQLSMLKVEENVLEQTIVKPKLVEYTITWNHAKMTFKASSMNIDNNGIPTFVLNEM